MGPRGCIGPDYSDVQLIRKVLLLHIVKYYQGVIMARSESAGGGHRRRNLLTRWAKSCNFITSLEHNKLELTDFANQSLKALSPLGSILHRAMEPSIED